MPSALRLSNHFKYSDLKQEEYHCCYIYITADVAMIALILCFNYSYRTQQYFLLFHIMSINFAVSAFILRCISTPSCRPEKLLV